MKYFKILAILLCCSAITFYSCNDDAKAPKQETSKPLEVVKSPTPTKVTTPNPPKVEPSQNAQGVWHYTCSKGCAGGAGSAGNCDTCDGPLGHNSAYHAKANSTQTATPYATPYLTPPTTTPAAATSTEPSQNTAGVWHYTCGKGCAGGAGAAGPCGNCGSTLAHNKAYHQ